MSKLLIAAMTCFIGLVAASNSPVFLWGVNSSVKPALTTISQKEFEELAAPLLKEAMVIAFLEENLSARDFLCTSTETADSCYAHLQGVSPKTYYASVENPVEALRAVADDREFANVDKSGKLQTSLTCQPGKVVFINFDSSEPGTERENSLEGHDAAISKISKGIDCPVVYMYLSAPSFTSVHRVRRQATPTERFCHRQGSQFLMCFQKLLAYDGDKPTELKVVDMSVQNLTSSVFTVTLKTADQNLAFNISNSDGYYSMGNVVASDSSYRSLNIEAPTDFSYACGNVTLAGIWKTKTEPNNKMLKFSELQLQAPFNAKYGSDFKFDEPWSCTGFVTPAILSGLFVILIMLAIVFTGICWMMDINTMDRFDDPKGKTITISTAE